MFNKYKNITVDNNETIPLIAENQSKMSLTDQANTISMEMQKPSIISAGAILDGNFTFNGILHLDGNFKGNLKASKVTIGKTGVFNGKLKADVVIVMGELKGEVNCNELALNAQSDVNAKISYDSIKIQPGSSIAGELICTHKVNLK